MVCVWDYLRWFGNTVSLDGLCLGLFTTVLLFTKAVNGAQYIFNGINERGRTVCELGR